MPVRSLASTLAAVAAFVALPSSALAESPLADSPSFTMSIGATSSANSFDYILGEGDPTGFSFGSGPVLANRLGVTFSKWVLFASLSRGSVASAYDGETQSASLATAGIGSRFYLKPLRVKKVSPYIMGQIFTTVAALDSGNDDLDDAASDQQTAGIQPAFGGEYAFSDALSIGGEVGISYSRSAYDDGDDTLEVASTLLTSAAYLNFYF